MKKGSLHFLSLALCLSLWLNSLAWAITEEEQAPFLLTYQALVGSDPASAQGTIETINAAVEEKFKVDDPAFKASTLGKVYERSVGSAKMAKNFQACQAAYPEFVTQSRQEHAGGRSTQKKTVYDRPEFDIKEYQDRLLEVSLRERFKNLDESDVCQNPTPVAISDSGNFEDILKVADFAKAKYDHPLEQSHEVKLQRELIAETLNASVYSYLHFMRQFGSSENTNGDIPLEAVVDKFCGGDTALTTKTVAGEWKVAYGSTMGGAIQTSSSVVPDQTVARCSEEQKQELKKEYSKNIKRLNREKVSKINLNETQKLLNEKIKQLNEKIELANNPENDPEFKSRLNFYRSDRGRNRLGSAEDAHRRKIKARAKKEYQNLYAELLSSPAGVLMQSDYLKDKFLPGGIGNPREFNGSKLQTHSAIELKNLENAVFDGKIKIAEQAKKMYDSLNFMEFEKTKLNNEDYLAKRISDLKDLFQANPGSVARVLARENKLSRVACLATVEIAKEMESNARWDKIYMGAGFVVGGALIATGVGSGLGAATIAGTAVSLGVTGAGVVHDHQVEAEALKDAANTELAIFAGSGDEYSREDLKKLQDEARSRLNGWRTASVLAPLDLVGLGQSFKIVKNLSKYNQFAKSLDDADLVRKTALFRQAQSGLFGDGNFGRFIGDISQADEATKTRFLEKLKSWDGKAESLKEHFADFKPELAKLGGEGAADYKRIEKVLGPLTEENRAKYVELLNDPKKIESFLAKSSANSPAPPNIPEVLTDYNKVRNSDPNTNRFHPKNVEGSKINTEFLDQEKPLTGQEDFAIGLSEENGPVFNLADRLAGEMKRPVLTYFHWNSPHVGGLFPPNPNKIDMAKDLESVRTFMQNFKDKVKQTNDRKLFHVSLDGNNSFARIFKSKPGEYHTSTEVYALLSDPELLARTNFYENGRILSATEVEQRLAPYKKQIEELRAKYPLKAVEKPAVAARENNTNSQELSNLQGIVPYENYQPYAKAKGLNAGITDVAFELGQQYAGDASKIEAIKGQIKAAELEMQSIQQKLLQTTSDQEMERLLNLSGQVGAKYQYYKEMLEYADEATALASGKPERIAFWQARRTAPLEAPQDLGDYNRVANYSADERLLPEQNIKGKRLNNQYLRPAKELDGSEDFAIGLSEGNGYVFNMADRLAGEMNRPVLTYTQWSNPHVARLFPDRMTGSGSLDLPYMREFFQNLVTNAKKRGDRKLFHVNLDGGNSFEKIFASNPGDYHSATEVYAILSDPELLARTNFYEKGKLLSAEEVQKRLAPYQSKIEELSNQFIPKPVDSNAITSTTNQPPQQSILDFLLKPIHQQKKVNEVAVLKTTEAVQEQMIKKGIGYEATDTMTALSADIRWRGIELKRTGKPGVSHERPPHTGTVFEIKSLPQATHSNPDGNAYTHREMAEYKRKLDEMGVKLVVDSSTTHTGAGAYFWSVTDVISLPPNSSWSTFIHEFQHAQFDRSIESYMSKLSEIGRIKLQDSADRKMSIESIVKTLDQSVGDAYSAEEKMIIATYALDDLPVNGLNERLSTKREQLLPGWNILRKLNAELYGLSHNLTDLRSVRKQVGQLTPEQKAHLNRFYMEYTKSIAKTGALIIGPAVALGGAKMIGSYTYSFLEEHGHDMNSMTEEYFNKWKQLFSRMKSAHISKDGKTWLVVTTDGTIEQHRAP